MDWPGKNFRIVYHSYTSTMAGRLEGCSSSGLVHSSSLHSLVQSLLRSCLPIVAGRKAGGRWRGFITSVANRNLRAMSFYRKEEARNVRAFCFVHLAFALTLFFRRLPCSFDSLFSSSSAASSSFFSLANPSTVLLLSRSLSLRMEEETAPLLQSPRTLIERSFLPIISQNGKVTESDCFPS